MERLTERIDCETYVKRHDRVLLFRGHRTQFW